MSFDKNGFLGKEVNDTVTKIHLKYTDLITFLKTLNKFSHEIQNRLTIDIKNSQEVICATLFIKTLSTFQAFLLISERGMKSQAEMLLRGLIESLFILVASSKSKDFVREYANQDLLQRKNIYNRHMNSSDKALHEMFKNEMGKNL